MRPAPSLPSRRARLRTLAATCAVVLLVAACGSDADPAATPADEATQATDTGSATDTASATDTGSATDTVGTTVAVADTDLGQVLVDGEGMTLYVFDEDDVDTSACTEGCLGTWPPLLAEDVMAGDGVTADLGTFTRDDGDVQVTVNGLPLYFYAPDAAAGDVTGQGVGDVWWVVDPSGAKVTGTPTGAASTTEAGYGDPDY